MIDPLLKDFDMPLLIDFPLATKDVPHLDAVLITHSDNVAITFQNVPPISVSLCQ